MRAHSDARHGSGSDTVSLFCVRAEGSRDDQQSNSLVQCPAHIRYSFPILFLFFSIAQFFAHTRASNANQV